MQVLQILHLQFISWRLNTLNKSEFLKCIGKVYQFYGFLYTIESIRYFTVDLQLVINVLGFLKKYGQSFLLISRSLLVEISHVRTYRFLS